MRHVLISFLLYSSFVCAQTDDAAILNQGATLSYALRDIQTGELIYRADEQRLVPLASTQKLLTTSAAFHHLGADRTFKTRFYVNFSQSSGDTLHSDIVIRGGGDPTFSIEDLQAIASEISKPYQAWDGKLLVDDRLFEKQREAGTWPLEDPGNYYGGGTHAFILAKNEYRVKAKASEVGSAIQILATEPEGLFTVFTSEAVAGPVGSGDKSFIYGWGDTKQRVLRGTLGAHKVHTIRGSIPNPTHYFAKQFVAALNEAGMAVTQERIEPLDYLLDLPDSLVVESGKVSSIVQETNFKSDNLYAETLFKHLSTSDGQATFSRSIEVIQDWLADLIGQSNFVLYDGSGLSPNNVGTAQNYTRALAAYTAFPWFPTFLQTIPVVGQTGTARYVRVAAKPAMTIYCKTGSIKGCRNLAGYIQTEKGMYTFFIGLSNYYTDTPSKYRLAEAVLQRMIKKIPL